MLSTSEPAVDCHPSEKEVRNGFAGPMLELDLFVREKAKIVKSENDTRLYRLVTLHNQLKLLLISDSQTDKAAACLAVGIGSFSDPAEIPGLAHFCEHMILLGSRKYPEENGCSKFITSHNGYMNAFTTSTETCYVFDIAPEYLYEALERFSNLFESPLFTESATEREVNAVNSEHEKNCSVDNRRIIQIDKLLASQDHDYAKFSTGNKATLFDNLKAKSLNVRDELVKFHAKYYSSNIMAVTILGKEPLDKMESSYVPLFQNIPNLNVSPRIWQSTPWKQECLQPVRYLTHLLGHESAGSLLSELKRRKLAVEIVTESYRPGPGFACILVYVNLTDQGFEQVDEIITLIFQYINMLKAEGYQQWVLEEERDMQAVAFRFKCKEDPFDYVYKLSPRMFICPPEDLLTFPYLISEFRPDLIDEIFSYVTPDNFRYFVISKKTEDSCNEVEEYYNTRYGCESIPPEKLEAWQNCGLSPALRLPPKNPFMPSDFSLKCESNPDPEDLVSAPRVLEENAGTLLWFKQDSIFKLPKSFVNFNLISPLWAQDPVREVLLQLFVDLFADYVGENAYQYALTGLCFDICTAAPALRLVFSGYSHKMPLLVENTVNALMQFTRPDWERYEVLLRQMELRVKNFISFSPIDQADGYYFSALFDRSYQYEERVAALEQVTYEELLQFIPSFFNRVFVETLVYGNVDTEDALKYNQIMINALKTYTQWRPPVFCPSAHMREVEIPTGPAHILKRINRSNEISAIRVYYQTQPLNAENCAMHRLFDQIIREPAFTELRTQKQLGYIVRAGWQYSNSFQGICVMIQSKYHPRDLDDHIEEFIASVEEMLRNMSDKEFEDQKESVIAMLLLKPKKMSQQLSKYWGQIVRQRYDFDRFEREAEFVRNTNKEKVISFYRTYIKATSEVRRKLAIYVISGNAPISNKEDMGIAIENLAEYKRSLPLRPLAVPRRCRTNSTSKPITIEESN
ncbi:hypothetical protein Aperf_G00000021084 [Anoplocephala perfoliata]